MAGKAAVKLHHEKKGRVVVLWGPIRESWGILGRLQADKAEQA